ncbi:hypothetical protein [Fodinibius saliphilus]|uniref:hypothetical protein n=1 Tax=Fodinibius saliphilus TaxID=1920650 RepID=UPI001108A842|nr:hypothetical protein [Fodinibius saliphilus]
MSNYKYQIRDNIVGKTLKEETNKAAVVLFLSARTPSLYTIFRVDALTNEVRQIVDGSQWLSDQRETRATS